MNQTTNLKSKKRKPKWVTILLSFLSLLVLAVAAGFIYEWFASRQVESDYPAPGTLVEAGGYRLHIHKQGSGSPTILLEAGSGETSLSWRDIPEQLAESATVVSYDRAGYAWSERADTERSGANIVQELHTAMEAEWAVSTEDAIRGQQLGALPVRIIARGIPQDYASFPSGEFKLRLMLAASFS
ncbi:alpha/beta fold hydrolase [Paenibacillus donghaensis]|uniref:alpha/beta fold hydrolase n=1 Tax=Paenibacillus donghaensis TaxID=414771 RepID=UPI0026C6AA8D